MTVDSAEGTRRGRIRRVACRIAAATTLIATAPFVLLFGLMAMLSPIEEPVVFDTHAAQGITFTPPTPVVPGPGLPAGLEILSSNNVIDLIEFEGRFFLAFRSGPTHYASTRARIIVLSSTDRKRWELECEFGVPGGDVREPRLLAFKGKLFLYFFQAGDSFYEFIPKSMYATERLGFAQWTEPRPFYEPGYVPWRARARGDTAYMSVYFGQGLYNIFRPAGEVRLLVSTDGYDWRPISDEPQVAGEGAEEADFDFDEDGNLIAIVRLEMEGGMVCRASRDNLAKWECRFTPHKYDSSFLFRRGNDTYAVARRSVSGVYNRGWTVLPDFLRRGSYLIRYAFTRKRTTLFKLDAAAQELTPLFDFPSRGDTAYACLWPLSEHRYYMVYYSTSAHGIDWPWTLGQVIGCNIYETELAFPTSDPGADD